MTWSTLPRSTKRLRSQSKKKAKEIRDSRQTVAEVKERDGGCVLRTRPDLAGPCWGGPTAHHLRKQSKRRGDWRHRVLVTLCVHHNDVWVEDHPIEARAVGLVISDGDTEAAAWQKMRDARLAVGRLVEPCPGSEQPPEGQPDTGLRVCRPCGNAFQLVANSDGGPGGVLPEHTRELDW